MKLQPHNGLIIKSFFMDMRDKELIRIIPLLVFMAELDDMRTVRDWAKKFNEESMIEYQDKKGIEKLLNRNSFLKFVVDKIHTEHLDRIFHGESGDKNVVIFPKKSDAKPLCDSMDDLATSDVDYEEVHK